jgi:hypothetical protein
MREPDEPLPPPVAETDEGVLRRWSRRKARAQAAPLAQTEDLVASGTASGSEPAPAQPPPDALTDADMPPLESLDEDSDYSAFMSPKVGEELRRLALRKLFHLPKFNVCDGLDDYDDDYRGFEALGEVITADLRHRMELAAEKAKAQAEQGPDTAAPETVAESEQDQEPQGSMSTAPQGPSVGAEQGPAVAAPQGPPQGAS